MREVREASSSGTERTQPLPRESRGLRIQADTPIKHKTGGFKPKRTVWGGSVHHKPITAVHVVISSGHISSYSGKGRAALQRTLVDDVAEESLVFFPSDGGELQRSGEMETDAV